MDAKELLLQWYQSWKPKIYVVDWRPWQDTTAFSHEAYAEAQYRKVHPSCRPVPASLHPESDSKSIVTVSSKVSRAISLQILDP